MNAGISGAYPPYNYTVTTGPNAQVELAKWVLEQDECVVPDSLRKRAVAVIAKALVAGDE